MNVGARLFAMAMAAGLLSMTPGNARAEASHFTIKQLDILNARLVVNEPSGRTFREGEDLVLTVRPSARHLFDSRLHVRMFALAPGQEVPASWATFDPCKVFFSAVLTPHLVNGRINLRNLQGMGVLHVEQEHVTMGRFLIVFEAGGDVGEMVRLNAQDVALYFGRGLYIEVLPARAYSADEVAQRVREISRKRAALLPAAMANNPSLNCYRAQTAENATSSSDRLAMLDTCGTPGG